MSPFGSINLFAKEKQFAKISGHAEELEALKQEYRGLVDSVEKMLDAGEISAYSWLMLRDMSRRVNSKLAKKYKDIEEGVVSVSLLFKAGRNEDAVRAAEDKEFQAKLLAELLPAS